MPYWGWWLSAVALLMFWKTESMVRGYWFGGWWKTIAHRPLGDWRAIDLVPFLVVYVAVRLIYSTTALWRELEKQELERKQAEPQSQVK
ncbi:MAG: hypothetical protein ABW171_02570 [Steroidobacter sp.]